jgi:hypothetical protein
MINISKLTENDIGRWVIYTAPNGATENGRIKSWNKHYIFVVYHCADKWNNYMDYTAAATRPEDLTWLK